ncbi:HdeD family acid-resistance protein [Patescibacteria group bacterium]
MEATKKIMSHPGGMIWRGIIAMAFGVIAIIWPGITLNVLVILFAIFAIVDGAAAVITAIVTGRKNERWWSLVLEGIVGLVVGALILIWPDITLLVFIYLIAIWAIVTGLFEIVISFSLKDMKSARWFMLIAGIISLVLGVLIFFYPKAGLVVIAWLIGIYALVFGAVTTKPVADFGFNLLIHNQNRSNSQP